MRGRAALALLGAALIALPFSAGSASAQSKKVVPGAEAAEAGASDLDRMINLLQEMGFRATRDDSTTTPSIDSKIGGISSDIQLLNCNEGTSENCGILRFHAGFDLVDGIDLKTVNDWNFDKYFGRAYIDQENDPHVDLVVSMLGVSDDNLRDLVEWWEVVVGDFKEHINW